MKYAFALMVMMLTGCTSVSGVIGAPNMLDVAPKDEAQLAYPTWGGEVVGEPQATPQQMEEPTTPRKMMPATTMKRVESLEDFLNRSQIQYQMLPGSHIMLQLTDSIQFKTGSAQVRGSSASWIRHLGHYLSYRPDIDLVIDGHADSSGSANFNDTLSQKRAEQVKRILQKANMPHSRIYTRGYGELAPACNNASYTGKACNRRVELTLIVTR